MKYNMGKISFWLILVIVIIILPIGGFLLMSLGASNSIQSARNNATNLKNFRNTHLLSLDSILPQGEQKAGGNIILRGKGFTTKSNGNLNIAIPQLIVSAEESTNNSIILWSGIPTDDGQIDFNLPKTLLPGNYSLTTSIKELDLQSNSLNFTVRSNY